MNKVKVQIIFKYEYDFKLENYPKGLTIEEMLLIDKENIEANPNTFLERNCEVELKLVTNKNCLVCGDKYIGEHFDAGLCDDCKW
jgi:hypothetical protein